MNNAIRRATAVFIAMLLFTYVGYQLYLGNRRGMDTEVATRAEVSDYFEAEAFVLRQEEIVTQPHTGVINYSVSDGTRVAAGGIIADIYPTEENAAAKNKLAGVEKELADLTALLSPGGYYAANPEIAGNLIIGAVEQMILKRRANNYSEIANVRYDLQSYLNRRKIITGEGSPDEYNSRIAELENERDALQFSAGNIIGQIIAPKAGFFVSRLDGYESVKPHQRVERVTVSEVTDMLLAKAVKIDNPAVIGKIATEFVWYMVCVLTEDELIRLERVDRVTIEIPFSASGDVRAEIVAKNWDAETGKTAVVFKCTEMNEELSTIRKEIIKVNIRTYEGVLVNEKAIYFEDVEVRERKENGEYETKVYEDVMGVFIRYRERIQFVQIFYEKIVNGYAICKLDLNEEERERLVTSSTIKLYDQVIVGGTDLYDGKAFY